MTTTGDSPNQQKPTPPPAGLSPAENIPQPDSAGAQSNTVKPGATSSAAGVAQGANQNITFRSEDIGTKTAKKQDVFAEHRRKNAEEKVKQKIMTKRMIIFGGMALLLVALIVVLVVIIVNNSNTSTDDGNVISEAESEKRQQITQSVYDAASADGANADEIFQEALDSAKTPVEANAVRMGQLQYYVGNGEYEKMIDVYESDGDDICENVNLDIWARMRCHNMMALAYEDMSFYKKSDYHWERLDALQAEAERLGYGEDGQIHEENR